ncbi:transposase [Rhizobium sp. C104]|uniref:transposase n=1 Tax=Rhizobium sp. C104 TaxID=2917727 RepID=UPI001EF83583|nr:transposase [Rhizobium sp. C104]ULJ77371.1 transposase [Rhizobium sp. C104]
MRIVKPLFPAERGRKPRHSHDNRQFMNSVLHVLRVGCPWRDMHERWKVEFPLRPIPSLGRARGAR